MRSVFTSPLGRIDLVSISGNSSVQLDVPSDQLWELISLTTHYVSSADPGNRIITIDISSGSRFMRLRGGLYQTAGQSYEYNFGRGSPNDAATTSGVVIRNLPDGIELRPGSRVRSFDAAGISMALDSQTFYLLIRRRLP